VVDPVKELFQVHVHHDDPSLRDVFPCLSQGAVRPTPRSEAVAGVREGRVQQGVQHLQDRLLYEAVDDRRDAQLTHPATGFGDLHPTHRLRFIRAVP
jgi:site-specific DNA recombinase